MKRLAASLLAALLLAGCQRTPAVREYTFLAFGTLVELKVAGADPALAERARALAGRRLEEWHHEWNAWHDSPLTRLNEALARGETVPVPPSLTGLLPRAAALSKRSDGLFNPAIGGLIGLWGFHSDDPPQGPPPDDEAIRRLLESAPSMDDLDFAGGRVSSSNPALALDLGGFAKGVAVERLTAQLAGMGLDDLLLNAGGDLKVLGSHGDRPWRVGIRDPRGKGVLASVEPRSGEAVFTSGDYERYFTWRGRRYHHLIDPRTGHPARGAVSVTVIANDAGLADAAATALFIAGPGQWPPIAARLGVDRVMLVRDDGRVEMTAAMAGRVRFQKEPAPPVTIRKP